MKTHKTVSIFIIICFLLTSCIQYSAKPEEKNSALKEKTSEVKMNDGIIDEIHINQVGYGSKDKKIAVIKDRSGKFEVIDGKSKEVVFKGETIGPVMDASSGDTVFYADFTPLEKSGTYCISLPESGRSYPFLIKQGVYRNLKNSLLKAFYYQRCGIGLEEKYAGQWKHKACHLYEAAVYGSNGVKLDGSGGWHDAGDYGKYTVAAATALADLLLAYNFFPQAFKDTVNIPESGGKYPDILAEAKFELDWLFKMQDTATGGVYHKISTANFPGLDVMPEFDLGDLYFSPVSSTATADFAAVTALASRVYKPLDAEYSQKCLNASEKAWGWLMKNKENAGFKNPPDISTGEYGDQKDGDERFWAAAELYRTTGKKQYHEYFLSVINDGNVIKSGLGWKTVGGYGVIAYLFNDKFEKYKPADNFLRKGLLEEALYYKQTSEKDGYRISLKQDEYRWGSNSTVLNRAMLLIIADIISPGEGFSQIARYHLNYLLGCNALNQCFVTGFGVKSILHPHHRPSMADGIKEPVPGLVSGGPNSNLDDDFAKTHLSGLPPARCFTDDETTYSTNEVAIYWNSPAVFVAGYFDSF